MQSKQHNPENNSQTDQTRPDAVKHTNRTPHDIRKNDGAQAFQCALASLLNIPDVDLELSHDTLQWLRVKRQGITYGINLRNGPSTGGKLGRYVFAIGVEFDNGLVFPMRKSLCHGDCANAVNQLKKYILLDPRQHEIPAEHYRTHFTIKIPVGVQE